MRQLKIYLLGIITISFMFSNIYCQEFKYIGSKACGMCHKKESDGNQLKIWEGSKHAKAFLTLKTSESKAIMEKLGLTTNAWETEKCLKCHITGQGKPASSFENKFRIEDGVQCEGCHGAGSEYKPVKIMKNRTEAVAKGLVVFANKDEIKASCVTCHNPESPTYKEFHFTDMYEKIKHEYPETK